jgi:hypothetical protein
MLSPLSHMPQESSSEDANNKSEKLSSHSFPETVFFRVNKNIDKNELFADLRPSRRLEIQRAQWLVLAV